MCSHLPPRRCRNSLHSQTGRDGCCPDVRLHQVAGDHRHAEAVTARAWTVRGRCPRGGVCLSRSRPVGETSSRQRSSRRRRWVCWRIAVSCQHQATVALGLSMRLHRRCCLLHHMSHSLSEDSESGRRCGSSEHAGATWWRLGSTRAVPISRRPLPPPLFTPLRPTSRSLSPRSPLSFAL